MSVPPGRRGQSSMQFVDTAAKIEYRAMQVCRRWPKSWMFFITQRTVSLASEIYEYAQRANAIFPITTEREREDRLSALQAALGANYAFAQKIELAFSLVPICGEKDKASASELEEKSMTILEELMNLCLEEEEALKGNITYTRKAMIEGEKPSDSQEKKDVPD